MVRVLRRGQVPPDLHGRVHGKGRIHLQAIVELCRTIIEEGGYPNLDPELIAEGLSAMGEGLWLDLLVSPHDSNPELSKQTLSTYLAALFPKHFPIARTRWRLRALFPRHFPIARRAGD